MLNIPLLYKEQFDVAFYNKDIKQVFRELESSEEGLSSSLAAEKNAKFGENKLNEQKKVGFFKKLFK